MNERQLIIEARIRDDNDFAWLCLTKLYDEQMSDEQDSKTSHYTNKRGFSAGDASVLTIIKEDAGRYGIINEAMREILRERLPKYSKQLGLLLDNDEIY